MYGYPRRHQPARRATPTLTLFDPSSDSACTGWWRMDSGLQLNNVNRSLASGVVSRLPNAKLLTASGSPTPALLVRQASYGFPAIIPMTNWNANGVAQDGDRNFTYTVVMRFLRYHGDRCLFMGMDNMISMGQWDGWLRLWHPGLNGWPNWIDGAWPVFDINSIAVITVRMYPYDPGAGDNRGTYKINYNNAYRGPYTQDAGWGNQDRTLTTNHTIYITNPCANMVGFHELMTFRRTLSDTEVTSMHTLLMQQYGVAV